VDSSENESIIEKNVQRNLGWSSAIWANILLVGGFYFFVKFIRYALWSWTPFLLYRDYGLALDDAGYLLIAFDFAGAFGVIAAGFISDKYFSGRRVKNQFLFHFSHDCFHHAAIHVWTCEFTLFRNKSSFGGFHFVWAGRTHDWGRGH
tara:strand:- start:11 stop:454 length:444 start_codon:yes stop_codon:yes gene_type:complete